MKIDSSNVGMESARTYRSVSTRKLSVSVKIANFSLQDGGLANQDLIGGDGTDEKENSKLSDDTLNNNSEETLERLKSSQASNAGRIRSISDNSTARSIERVRERCILYLWQMFFGRKKAQEMAQEFGFESAQTEGNLSNSASNFTAITISGTQEYSFEEQEETSFSTTGTVRTADGREISFNLDVGMSRSFAEYYKEENVGVAAMCDPLVINLDDSIAGLSDQKFYFDLDMDGAAEEISTLKRGNGFLALDQNNDGVINDGSELFGASSGDGFADLARYDEDKNGWIDENDSVYQKLRIWVKDETGEDRLYTLKDKNVGAIYLGNRDTDFTLRSAQNGNVNGAIRKTGIFLYEDGAAGTISHLDIAN
ncbi:MAG: hypothetical protein ACI39N_00215 [Lachnospiraceae bacterium]